MAEAAKLKGQFRNWKPHQRDEKLKGFVEIIKAYPPAKAIYLSLDLEAFEEHMAPNLTKPMSDPFFIGCYTMLAGVCHEVLELIPLTVHGNDF